MVKVLYIEDNDDDVYMLKMRLELLGNFEVLTAEDGERGSQVAAAAQPEPAEEGPGPGAPPRFDWRERLAPNRARLTDRE